LFLFIAGGRRLENKTGAVFIFTSGWMLGSGNEQDFDMMHFRFSI
jgi:hypothetical protein